MTASLIESFPATEQRSTFDEPSVTESTAGTFISFISFAVCDVSAVSVLHWSVRACVRAFVIPERCGQFEGSDSRGGKAQRVSVGDLLHCAVKALNIVSLQH